MFLGVKTKQLNKKPQANSLSQKQSGVGGLLSLAHTTYRK